MVPPALQLWRACSLPTPCTRAGRGPGRVFPEEALLSGVGAASGEAPSLLLCALASRAERAVLRSLRCA